MDTEIIHWIQYDNKIKEYNQKCKKLREERDKLGETMIQKIDTSGSLPTYNITQMNTSLSFQKSKTYENYTNKFYKECFTEFLGSEEKANELFEFMKKKRKVEEKMTLKRGIMVEL
tara:strand:+ start:1841 stop:2188 length:348 start_codon:yes stop_codon:yes gene_type:complete